MVLCEGGSATRSAVLRGQPVLVAIVLLCVCTSRPASMCSAIVLSQSALVCVVVRAVLRRCAYLLPGPWRCLGSSLSWRLHSSGGLLLRGMHCWRACVDRGVCVYLGYVSSGVLLTSKYFISCCTYLFVCLQASAVVAVH